VWVKLSGAYRNGSLGAGEATALRAVPLLQSAFGLDRLLWGSDWPHTLFEPETSYTAEREALNRWLPVAADRQRVLADTPAALFGF
jgi:predicted TIM-barrel fold metal-dependent hydrolase